MVTTDVAERVAAPRAAPATPSAPERKPAGRPAQPPVPGAELRLQAKLRVGAAHELEHQADRMADAVLSGQAAEPIGQAGGCGCGASTGCHCGETAPASVRPALSSSTTPLDPGIRTTAERAFGADLSGVRVGVDPVSTADLGARAYTVGDTIVVDPREYAPRAPQGQRLLLHELSHVMQQRAGGSVAVHRQQAPAQQERYCPNGEVNDANVQRLIDEAMRFARTSSGGTDLDLAFAHLRTAREGHCCDLDRAAAEHYMWARLSVADGDWSFVMIMLVIMYDIAKFFHLVPRTGDCPITRASAAQIQWASQGAVDGEMDYYSTPP